ncbi:MAG: putative membrane-associated protein [Phormidesmis priestleyi Ana]|uniref:Putative membrane-associated protein n=1 Tax=Phormidesmis priestleyi Ana TaxID=1666911 RepID=A0A0P7YU22_9CYAN|nr:MAG: putative membrane-associated protein [Phormidesmis priestleyi Ana]
MGEIISIEIVQDIAREYGYWAIFLGVLLENMGIPIPGETVTLVGGFLAGSDELNVWYVLGAATAGAILGDSGGYWLGYYGGWPLLVRVGKILNVPETALVGLRDRFSKNADKAVLLGRFVTLLRVFAGPLAGITKMPYGKFLLCNAIGAATWASVMVSLTYFLGQLVPLPTIIKWITQFTGIALVLVIGFVAIAWWIEARRGTKTAEL